MVAYEVARGNLDLEDGEPTLQELVTHTSGYSDEWEQAIMENMDRTFTREELIAYADSFDVKGGEFEYSNIGSALAGTRAAEAYGKDMGLESTSYQDEMLADGAITSNVTDLLKYGRLYLNATENVDDVNNAFGSKMDEPYAYLKRAVTGLANVDENYDIGMFWIIDDKNDIWWHNGEISMEGEDGKEVGYQSFIGISPSRNKVVVILSNAICYDEDETAYTDIQLAGNSFL